MLLAMSVRVAWLLHLLSSLGFLAAGPIALAEDEEGILRLFEELGAPSWEERSRCGIDGDHRRYNHHRKNRRASCLISKLIRLTQGVRDAETSCFSD
jgi:hypothetical protein